MIRLATPADLSQAADIYEEILDREAQGPVYTNWQRGKYPTIDTARQALEAGTFYVGEENGVLWGVVIEIDEATGRALSIQRVADRDAR